MKKYSFIKTIKIILCLLLLSSLLKAQSFSVELENNVLSGPLGTELIFNFHVTNESSSELTLYFSRVINDLPEEWSSSLCFDACFAPFLDSVVTNAGFNSSPIQVGETREFSVHVFPLTNDGQANITIKVGVESDPANFKQFELIASSVLTDVSFHENSISSFQLDQNYPNPFNPNTIISFNLPASGQVRLKVFNALGQEVANLIDDYKSAGNHTVEFGAKGLSSGVYFYSLQTGDKISIKKMVLGK